MIDDFEIIDPIASSELFGPIRGPYKRKKYQTPVIDVESDNFEVLDELQTQELFEFVTPEYFDSLPAEVHKAGGVDSNKFRPICFVDGEGANEGERVVTTRKHNLQRWVQKQNYALFGAVLQSTGEYKCIVGLENYQQLSSKQCLDFILSLPADHILVGYSLTYDVEHWLKDIPPGDANTGMGKLIRTQAVWWHGYRIHYIPKKIFTVGKYKGKKKIASRTVYDIFGFFQCEFKRAIRTWNVGTPEEWEFIDRMKDARSDFGPITDETKAYNRQEGLHGIELFSRVRAEYTKLKLSLPRPVGAGSIASAMFRKHGVMDFFPTIQLLPTDVMLASYFGGRFDITRIGFMGNVFESDINSAYPHIARNLPCLRCGRYIRATGYTPDKHSLWLVRWSDNGTQWSPFPYRTDNGHIRYYANGVGYYYGSEVAAALQLNPDTEIIGGYQFIQNCDHRPFEWLEDYYQRRQEMLQAGDFGEQIIKYGSNSVYGKLAQSKGKNPKYQNLIWAGMITAGTRAMLLNGIAQNPGAVIKAATDALFSTVPLNLEYDETELGCWKTEELYDLLVLGNGVYHSTGSSNPKHPNGVAKNRGFARGEKLMFDWEAIRQEYAEGKTSVVMKREFRRFIKAWHEKKVEERCYWIDSEVELKLDIQKQKRVDGENIYPLLNPTPQVISAPARINPENLKQPGGRPIVH
jgi:hypothetical protein